MRPAAHYAYLANINDHTVVVLDLETMETVDVIAGFDSPYGVVVTADGSKVYIDNAARLASNKQYVAVLDTSTRKVVKRIPVATRIPVSAITKRGDAVYMADVMHKRIHRIATDTDEVTQTYQVPGRVAVAIPSPDDRTLWVGTVGGKIHTLDTETGHAVGAPIKAPMSAGWLTFTPGGETLVSVHALPNSICIIDVETRQVMSTVHTGRGSFPEYGAMTPDGRQYWVTLGNGKVKVVDIGTSEELATLDAGSLAFGVRISPDGKRAFVTTMAPDAQRPSGSAAICTYKLLRGSWNPRGDLVTYDTTTFQELGRTSVGGAPTIMSYAGAEG